MTKQVIAIISVLKPVDDTRNYEKVGRSLSNTNKYEINIIGFSGKNIPLEQNITFYPIFNFHRTSPRRFLAPNKTLKLLLKVKPELIIVTCAESLLVSVFYKIIFGAKIIYDIQENYYRNFLYSGAYSTIFKFPLAVGTRMVEMFSSLFIDRCFLAEKVYLDQLKFISKKSVILENKAIKPNELNKNIEPKTDAMVFVYTGTIAEHYGIFDAIDFIVNIKSKIEKARLIIIGNAAQPKIYQKIMKIAASYDFIEIKGGNALVPHDQILKTLRHADFCLLPYRKNKSTAGRIPTKLYECLSMEIPVIITPNPVWKEIIDQNNAGIMYDFSLKEDFNSSFLNQKFYGNNMTSNHAWNSNEQLMLDTVSSLF